MYFKREINECIGTGARTKLHKIKIVFFLISVCSAMTSFSSRNTSLWRFNDVFRDEKCVIVPLTLSKKTTILILCDVVLSPVPIHSFFSRLKYPLVWPNMVVWWEIWISLISCNFTPFYPIKMGFSPEIIEFYAEN